MTGTAANTQPVAEEGSAESIQPILCNAELNLELPTQRLSIVKAKQSACPCTGLTLVTLCRLHLAEPKASTTSLLAGQKLLELRKRIEAGELGAVDWWPWVGDDGPIPIGKLGARAHGFEAALS
jgi:hypothetical protein